MITSSRRNVMKGAIALSALGVMPATLLARGRVPAVFIYDARFEASREMAQAWQLQGVAILDPREHDLGLAWREHIPQLLANGGGIEGATLWSDRFVCEAFGKEHGLAAQLAEARLPGDTTGSLRHWIVA